jgi:hypothetical protein
MEPVLYKNTNLNLNLIKIIDLYSIIRPRYYKEELLKKTKHIKCMCNHFFIMGYKYSILNYKVKYSKNLKEWLICRY